MATRSAPRLVPKDLSTQLASQRLTVRSCAEARKLTESVFHCHIGASWKSSCTTRTCRLGSPIMKRVSTQETAPYRWGHTRPAPWNVNHNTKSKNYFKDIAIDIVVFRTMTPYSLVGSLNFSEKYVSLAFKKYPDDGSAILFRNLAAMCHMHSVVTQKSTMWKPV
jgi:hypothetical protein